MAKKVVVTVVCDRCGHEDEDMGKYYHVLVTTVVDQNSKSKPKTLQERDLCESCVGMPGVNREN